MSNADEMRRSGAAVMVEEWKSDPPIELLQNLNSPPAFTGEADHDVGRSPVASLPCQSPASRSRSERNNHLPLTGQAAQITVDPLITTRSKPVVYKEQRLPNSLVNFS